MTDDLTQPHPHEEFVALYVVHQVAIRSFVRTLLPDPADAEDVMQTASMTMWRRFEQFQPGTSFRNWAFQVAKFVAMKHVARKTRDRLRFSEATIKLLAQHVEQQDERLAGQRRSGLLRQHQPHPHSEAGPAVGQAGGYARAGGAVEIAGGLVGEDDLWA